MSYVRGEDRGQAALATPGPVEDYVTADGPVRVIVAFVEASTWAGLDLGGRPMRAQRYGLQHYPRHQPPRRSKSTSTPRLKNEGHSAQQKGPGTPEPLTFHTDRDRQYSL
jgi:hypothetical protein